MRAPKPDKEDPAVVAAREREERRAESARTSETQALLVGATQRRLRRTGRLGSGGVPLIAAASDGGGAMGVMGGGLMGGSSGGYSNFGGSGPSFGDFQTSLY
jgi:hypothetical protein